ncbi:extracellular solute-binding protein [Paenibacillus shunpengii]|uniref:Extracellular solute-binding protein n=1 Tax=Paenibacillus shunpengii TaxID=2054424 RepID=A0ABW5SPD9_9BACL
MRRKTTSIKVLSLSLALTTILAGCGSNSSSNNNESPSSVQSKKQTEISIFTINYSAETPQADNVIELEMEKRTDTKLDITFQPANSFDDKFKVTLSSGQLPDVMLTKWIWDSAVLKAIEQGAFWDLTPFIKDYPNLASVYADAIENTKVNGKVYGIPRPRPLVGGQGFPMLREDWLKNLNLEIPQTMDELYNVLKAFTEEDPDQNGKKDTMGYIGNVAENWMDKLTFVEDVFHGHNDSFKYVDGKIIWRDLEPAEKDALLWMKKTYDEGILAPDFAIIKNSQMSDFLKQGKVGMLPYAMDASQIGDMLTTLRATTPEAGLVHVPTLESPATGQPFYPKEGGFFGNYLISKKVPEAKLRAILEFFDYGATEEGMELASYGLADQHFSVVEGLKTTTEEHKKSGLGNYNNIWTLVDEHARIQPKNGFPVEYYERDKEVIKTRIELGYYNNMNGVTSETENKYMPEWGKKVQDMKIRVIMGKESIEAWDKFVDTMKNNPDVQKMLEEKLASYQALGRD